MVRIWCLPDLPDFDLPDPKRFCAMNYEIQVIVNAAVFEANRYTHHPEVLKWKKRLGELITFHDKVLVSAFKQRGYCHNSPLKNIPEHIKASEFKCTFEETLHDLLEIRLRQIIDRSKPSKSPRSAIATSMMKEIINFD